MSILNLICNHPLNINVQKLFSIPIKTVHKWNNSNNSNVTIYLLNLKKLSHNLKVNSNLCNNTLLTDINDPIIIRLFVIYSSFYLFSIW
jgi:hypothetical protein